MNSWSITVCLANITTHGDVRKVDCPAEIGPEFSTDLQLGKLEIDGKEVSLTATTFEPWDPYQR